jgi:glycosyltransferase involved in cell wall biosynthesis
MSTRFAVISAVNDQKVLEQNLLRSPMLRRGDIPLITEWNHNSAGRAYNAGIAKADADVLIFAHQDVYFPPGWDEKLSRAIATLDASKAAWGVLGVWGVRADGQYRGRVWCSGSNQEFAVPITGVEPIESIDEIVIICPASARLRFDETLPGYHLYATDIIRQARRQNLLGYVFNGPVVHNSRTVPQLGQAYVDSYRYMQKKWRAELPMRTCVVPVTRFGWPLKKYRMRVAINLMLRRVTCHPRRESPVDLSRTLGYET